MYDGSLRPGAPCVGRSSQGARVDALQGVDLDGYWYIGRCSVYLETSTCAAAILRLLAAKYVQGRRTADRSSAGLQPRSSAAIVWASAPRPTQTLTPPISARWRGSLRAFLRWPRLSEQFFCVDKWSVLLWLGCHADGQRGGRLLPACHPKLLAHAHLLESSLPLGLPSPPPFPKPLLPRPPEAAIAVEFSEVESSIVIAGGVTAANFPQVARNFRRSSSGFGTWSREVM